MSRKLFLVLIVTYFFSYSASAQAGILINEVRISPIEDRFIELYNSGDGDVDLTNWYIQRKTQSGSTFGSLVTKTNFENKKINGKGYFLISRGAINEADIILDNLTLTESNTIQIKNGNGEVVHIICFGEVENCGLLSSSNPNENQSVQINQNGLLVIGDPSPGRQNFLLNNSLSQVSPGLSSMSIPSVSPQVTPEPKIKTEEPKIKIKITAKTFGLVGIPVFFQATTLGRGGEELYSGKYFWNFGDADSREIKYSINQPLSHTYFYPGDYTISLFYYQNYYSNVPDATTQINIKIVPAEILISKVGNEQDFFIELSNDTIYDVDLSGWMLTSNQKIFSLPHGTVLVSGKRMVISPKISNFNFSDKDALKLMNSNYELVSSHTPIPAISSKFYLPKPLPQVVREIPTLEETEMAEISSSTNLASVISSNVGEATGKNNFYVITGFFVFIMTSAYLVYFIRQRRLISQPGDDFDILDE